MGAVAPVPEHFSHQDYEHHQAHADLQHLTHPNGPLHGFVGLGPPGTDPLSLAMMPTGMLQQQVGGAQAVAVCGRMCLAACICCWGPWG